MATCTSVYNVSLPSSLPCLAGIIHTRSQVAKPKAVISWNSELEEARFERNKTQFFFSCVLCFNDSFPRLKARTLNSNKYYIFPPSSSSSSSIRVPFFATAIITTTIRTTTTNSRVIRLLRSKFVIFFRHRFREESFPCVIGI